MWSNRARDLSSLRKKISSPRKTGKAGLFFSSHFTLFVSYIPHAGSSSQRIIRINRSTCDEQWRGGGKRGGSPGRQLLTGECVADRVKREGGGGEYCTTAFSSSMKISTTWNIYARARALELIFRVLWQREPSRARVFHLHSLGGSSTPYIDDDVCVCVYTSFCESLSIPRASDSDVSSWIYIARLTGFTLARTSVISMRLNIKLLKYFWNIYAHCEISTCWWRVYIGIYSRILIIIILYCTDCFTANIIIIYTYLEIAIEHFFVAFTKFLI